MQAHRDLGFPSADVIEAKLRERGMPTSTIRQLRLVLEELGVIRK
jgi:hypothetical protein